MKILTIIGARPQFIKAGAVSREFLKHDNIQEVIVHTGQHFDKNMSDIFFTEMQIPKPDYHLNINSLSHGAMTGRMLEGIEEVIVKEKPNYLLVYGDTNSTLAGALAASKLHIKVLHVEAGLRSFNMNMPEEINRILTDRISNILFCPTDNAIANLKNEGFDNFDCQVVNVGDVMLDAAMFYANNKINTSDILERLDIQINEYLLCTIHRAENTDNIARLTNIITALNQLAEQYKIILPIHPRTKKILEKNNLALNFEPIEPVGYFDMIRLTQNSKMVLTDSGGLQKEAFFFGKYCLTLRDETEWIELINNHVNVIVGSDTENILQTFEHCKNSSFPKNISLYGNGQACKNICNTLLKA